MRRFLSSTVLTICLLHCGQVGRAQIYSLNVATNGTTINTCSGTIYDSGGPSGDYSDDQDYSLTICSDNGLPVYFQMNYDVEYFFDNIFVYDGPGTASPQIASFTNSGTTTIQGTGTCLTIEFTSDGSVTDLGFEVIIGCGTAPPPPPVPDCATANPFCTDTDEEFVNQTGQPAPTGVDDFGCLATQPNPSWYFFAVDEDGDLSLTIAQESSTGVGLDVDFIAWGPFESAEVGCSQLNSSYEVDCSYSASATEVVNIDNAQIGELYIILITNYSGQAGTLEFTQSGGGGSTDCDVLIECDPPTVVIEDASCSACDGQVSVQANSVAPYAFNWTDDSGTAIASTDDATSGESSVTELCPGEYSLLITDADGCEREETITVAQGETPTASISGSQSICADQSADLTIDCTGNAPWSIVYEVGGAQFTEDIASSPFSISGITTAGEYTLIAVQDGSGCIGTVSGSATIAVNDVSATFVNGDAAICDGEDALVAVDLTGTGPWTLIYTENGTSMSETSSVSPMTIYVDEAGPVELISITDATGCNAAADGSIEVAASTVPNADLSGGGTICDGETIDLQVALTGTGPWTIEYDLDGITQDAVTASTSPYPLTVSEPGTYMLLSVTDQSVCTGLLFGSATVDVNTTPTAEIAGNMNACPGDVGSLTLTLTGDAPWTVEYTDGTTIEEVVVNVSPYQLGLDSTGEYTLVSVASNGCTGTVSGSGTITYYELPTAELSGGGEICSDESTEVSIDFTGTGPWTIVSSIDGATQSAVTTSDDPYVYTTSEAGEHALIMVSSDGCDGSASGTAMVVVHEVPIVTVSGDESICPGEDAEVNLSVTANGEWTLDYEIDGLPQPSISSTATTYQTIEQQTATYTFTSITDELCTNDEVVEFSVATDAGPEAVLSGGGGACEGDSVLVDLQLYGSGPWTVTLEENGILLPSFSTPDDSYSFYVNETSEYTVSEVSDMVCVGTSEGIVSVDVSEAPNGLLSGDGLLCSGGVSEVLVTFSGSGNYTFEHAIDGIVQGAITTSENPYIIGSFSPAEFTLISVSDDNCVGSASGNLEVVEVPSPTAILGDGLELCAGEVGNLVVDLSGSGDWTIDYSIDGIPQPSFIATSNVADIFVNQAGEYALTGISDAQCEGSATGTAIVEIHELPTAVLSGEQDICAGESAYFDVILTGTAPWTIEVSDGVSVTETTTEESDYDHPVSVAGNYTLQVVSDAYCDAIGSGAASLTVHPLPTGELMGDGVNCEGQGGMVTVILEGTPGFDFVYTIDGVAQDPMSSTTAEMEIATIVDGQYELTQVSDLFCNGQAEGAVAIATLPLPTASLEGDFEVCANEVVDIPLEVSGAGPWSILYSIDGQLQPLASVDVGSLFLTGESEGQYELLEVEDINCINDASGTALIDHYSPIAVSVNADTAICIGQVALLDGQATGEQGGVFDFSWSTAAGAFSENESVIVNPEVTVDYVLTVTGACGIPYSDTTIVEVHLYPAVAIDTEDIQLCSRGVVEVENLTPSIYWGECEWSIIHSQTGELVGVVNGCSDLSFPLDSLGVYDLSLNVISPIGCETEEVYPEAIHVDPTPIADWIHSPSDPDILRNLVNFYDRSTDAKVHQWVVMELMEEFSDEPIASFVFPERNSAETYEVCEIVSNGSGCSDTLCIPVHIDGALAIWMPTAFTPNADRLNETLRPAMVGVDVEDYTFRVLDRSGKVIWETDDPTAGWNGQGAESQEFYSSDAVYNWQILIKQVDTADKIELKGMVTVVR